MKRTQSVKHITGVVKKLPLISVRQGVFNFCGDFMFPLPSADLRPPLLFGIALAPVGRRSPSAYPVIAQFRH